MHVVIDLIGAAALVGNLASLATRGRLIVVGLLGGSPTTIDLGLVLRKRLTLVGTTLRAAARGEDRRDSPVRRMGSALARARLGAPGPRSRFPLRGRSDAPSSGSNPTSASARSS